MPIILQEVDDLEVSIEGSAWRVVGFRGFGRGWGLARTRAVRKRRRRRRLGICLGKCMLVIEDVEREMDEN